MQYNVLHSPPNRGAILTSGSDLNKPALDSYPQHLGSSYKFFSAWREAILRFVQVVKVPANAGSNMSSARFGFRHREFSGVGNYPGSVPTSRRPTYNTLTPILWNLRVVNPNTVKGNATPSVIQIGPTQYFVPPPASIVSKNQWVKLG